MYYRKTCCLFVILSVGGVVVAQNKKPLKVVGNIGVSANYYNSNEPDLFYTRPSYAWNIYGSFTAKAGAFSMPVSFVVNQYDKSNKSPYAQFGFSPTYKFIKLHFGYRYIPFSPLTYDGQSFRGAGVELNPKGFRFAAFYGRLNKAVNEDTTRIRFRLPQYSRLGYGVKVGIGNSSSFFDLIYFHAKDDSNSVAFINDSTKRNATRAQENTVLGASFKITVAKKVVLTGDAAVSGLTQDLSYGEITADSTYQYKEIAKFISKFIPYNSSTIVSFAGQSSLSYYTRSFNTTLNYRRVQPDFKSLGTPYMLNDIELVSWTNNFSAIKGKLNVTSSLGQQHNNLNKKLNSKSQTLIGTININTILTANSNLNVNYAGYDLKQKAGIVAVKDSFSFQQKISQFSVTPSFNITKGSKLYFLNANVSYSTLNDKNPVTSSLTNSNNLSTSLSYTMAFANNPLSFSVNPLYSIYKQDTNSYRTYGATIGTSSRLLKNKSLNIQGTFGYLLNNFNQGTTQKNLTYSVTVGYSLKKHSFNLFANYVYTPTNAINNTINKIINANSNIPYAVSTKNLFAGALYNYTF